LGGKVGIDNTCKGANDGISFGLGQRGLSGTMWQDPNKNVTQDLSEFGAIFRDASANAMIGNGPRDMEMAWELQDRNCGICLGVDKKDKTT
jgi:hypothetical protein